METCKVCGKKHAPFQPFARLPEERVCMSCFSWLDRLLREKQVILTATGMLIGLPF